MDLDCDQGLDLDTVQLGSRGLETHNSQIISQDVISRFSLWVEIGLLLLSGGLGQGLIDTSGPKNLDTKEGDLGLLGIDPILEVDVTST
jgi:hypothetical protein